MDDEEIENQLQELKTIQKLGYMDESHFYEHRHIVASGMLKYGGGFIRELGNALFRADRHNSIKILRYWQAECDHHALLYKMYLAKERAKEEQVDGQ